MNTVAKPNNLKRNIWAVRILTTLVILAFGPSAILKLMHAPVVVQGFTHASIPEAAILPLGLIELFCLAVYLIPQTVVLGTLLLTGYLGGAIVTNIVNRTDFIHALVVGLFVWAGAWFRVAELQTLIPTRKAQRNVGQP
ncbi:MAG: DoxX family protein [Bryobacteraceae bacterium]